MAPPPGALLYFSDAFVLGSYRFLLALVVVFAHSGYNVLDHVAANSGFVAVICFFVVSGYVITGAIEKNYQGRIGHFLINRCLRIYPAFLFCVAVSLLILAIYRTKAVDHLSVVGWTLTDAIKSTSIVFGYPLDAWGLMHVGWSLQIEACFYIVIAAVYFLFPGRIKTASVCALATYVLVSLNSLAWESPLAFIPYFVLGIALSIGDKRIIALAGILTASAFLRSMTNAPHLPITEIDLAKFQFSSSVMSVYYAATLLALFFVMKKCSIGRRVDTLLGDITYPLYVSHFAVTAVMNFHGWIWAQVPVSVAVGYLVLLLVDRNIVPLRDKYRGDSPHEHQFLRAQRKPIVETA